MKSNQIAEMKIVAFTDVRAWRAESAARILGNVLIVFNLPFAAVLTALHDVSNVY